MTAAERADLRRTLAAHYARGGELTADVQRIARKAGYPLASRGRLLLASDADALAGRVIAAQERQAARDADEDESGSL